MPEITSASSSANTTLLATLEEAGAAAAVLTASLRVDQITREGARLLGRIQNAVRGHVLPDLLPLPMRPRIAAFLRKVAEEGTGARFTLTDRATGRRFMVRASPVVSSPGGVVALPSHQLVICRELRPSPSPKNTPKEPNTAQGEATLTALRESEERLRFTLRAAGMRPWEWDIVHDHMVLGADGDLLPTSSVPQQGMEVFLRSVHEEDRSRVRREIEQALAGEQPFESTFRVHEDGKPEQWVSGIGQVFRDETGRPIRMAGVIRDITARKMDEARIEWQAVHDILTSLPNRLHFREHVDAVVARPEAPGEQSRHAVLFVDLDGFKRINDTLGHSVGDAVLQMVARRLLSQVPSGCTIARQGGDEFTVLLPDLDSEQFAVQAAEQLLAVFAEPFTVAGHDLYLSASIGISIYPYDGLDAEMLIRHADVAMYHAKQRGRNTYQVHNEAMNRAAFDRLLLENDLRRALQNGEMSIAYQPQVTLTPGGLSAAARSGAEFGSGLDRASATLVAPPLIHGVEALMRWNHPEIGSVPRSRFIPLAEESGMIRALGEWIVRQACRQAKEWEEAGYPVRVAVNLSPRQLGLPGLVETVAGALRETGLAPDLLELEITESALIWNGEAAVAVAYKLKDLGVRLCVDDFGTGYSSLAYLRRFPLDAVKIDRSFVTEITHNRQTQAIVRAVIDLAHALSLWVVAEGVETEDQRDLLARLGCDLIQGHLFSPARPAQDITEMLLAR